MSNKCSAGKYIASGNSGMSADVIVVPDPRSRWRCNEGRVYEVVGMADYLFRPTSILLFRDVNAGSWHSETLLEWAARGLTLVAGASKA